VPILLVNQAIMFHVKHNQTPGEWLGCVVIALFDSLRKAGATMFHVKQLVIRGGFGGLWCLKSGKIMLGSTDLVRRAEINRENISGFPSKRLLEG